eukprot:6178373-Pleurochrysis_carterae.AAC.3
MPQLRPWPGEPCPCAGGKLFMQCVQSRCIWWFHVPSESKGVKAHASARTGFEDGGSTACAAPSYAPCFCILHENAPRHA